MPPSARALWWRHGGCPRRHHLRLHGVPPDALVRANGLVDPDRLRVGARIAIPGSGSDPAPVGSPINGLTTWYAHASRLLVRVGQRVARGNVVALVGTSGEVTGPNMHFEVRRNNIPLDPWPFLAREPL